MKAEDIQPIKKEDGAVYLIRTASSTETAAVEYLAFALSKTAAKAPHNESAPTTAILTSTNEQAYLAVEALNRKGLRARLIQSNECFSLYDLAEMRYFLAQIEQYDVPILSEEIWESAKQHLMAAYSRSTLLTDCLNLLEQFFSGEDKKYLTDLKEFLHEANFGDFYQGREDEICVSTIHKSKGHEFDRVYMALDTFVKPIAVNHNYYTSHSAISKSSKEAKDAELRKIYVGITRAKSLLYLFYNADPFANIANRLQAVGIQEHSDKTNFPKSGEIILPMIHKNVFFKLFRARKPFRCH